MKRSPIMPKAIPSTFRWNDKVLGVRRQGFGDQLFANGRTVGISGIDKIDAKLDGSAKNGYRRRTIPRWTPTSVSRQAHRSEAKAIDSDRV